MESEPSNKNTEENKPSSDALDSIESKIGKVDRILDKGGIVFKKHWGKILFILLCLFVYWAWNLPPAEPEQLQAEPSQSEQSYSDTSHYDNGNTDTTYYEDTLRN